MASTELRLGDVVLDGDDVYWVEGRPAESGRGVVVRRSADGSIADATPDHTNVRTRVQEYGGAPYIVSNGIIYFSEFSDQRLYRLKPGGVPEAMTPPGAWRYTDASIDVVRQRLICVREELAETTLVAIPLDGPITHGDVLASGYDFYSTPRVSPDGSHVAWLSWRHPQMPWNGTELWVAKISASGALEESRLVAGSDHESIFQPGWSPDGVLYFVSDRTNWWNLYRVRNSKIEPVHPVDAECGRPQWVLGTATWAFIDVNTLVIAQAGRGRWGLRQLKLQTADSGLPIRDAGPPTDFEPGEFVAANASHVVFVGGSDRTPDAVLRIDLATGRTETVRASAPAPDPATVSVANALEFATEGGLTAHAFYYAPLRAVGQVLDLDEPPPLIVMSHGGPTSATSARFNPEIQFWTSEGFAVVDVNYGGSSGYGRAYRERLRGKWGIVDVTDCVNAAECLAARRLADPYRLVIRGRSAGGFTTLAALTFLPGVFAAGASYYGIGDLELLARDTHKFESRYLDQLVGPYPARRDLYRERSPIHHVDHLACPLILFQGMDDTVVPPEHAEKMAAALRAKGLAVELVLFPGEGHGFRREETIAASRKAELAFYRSALSDR